MIPADVRAGLERHANPKLTAAAERYHQLPRPVMEAVADVLLAARSRRRLALRDDVEPWEVSTLVAVLDLVDIVVREHSS